MWDANTSSFLNSTTEPSADPGALDLLRLSKLCVFVVIFTLSVIGNTLVILSVLLFDKMKIVPNLFIANLAACDLTTTVFSIPFDLVEIHLGYFPYGRVMCSVLWPLATLSTTSASLTLLAISCDRYVTINHPLNFSLRITRKRCLKIIAMVHLVSFMAVLPYSIFLRYSEEPDPSCNEEWPPGAPFSKIYTFVLFAMQYAVPLLVMSVIYLQLGIVLFKNTKEAHKLSVSTFEADSGERQAILKRKEQNSNITKMFLIVVVIFLVFMMPHQVLYLFLDYANVEVLKSHGDVVRLVSRAFTYTNAVLNVVIYGACNRSFRETFKLIAKCQCSKEHEKRDSGRNLMRGHLNAARKSGAPFRRDMEVNGNKNMVQQHSNGVKRRECGTEANGKSTDRKKGNDENRNPQTNAPADHTSRLHPVQIHKASSPECHQSSLEKKDNVWSDVNTGNEDFIRETIL